MKKFIVISFLFFFSTSAIHSQEIIGASSLLTSQVDNWLESSFENLETLRQRAISDANLAVEQRIMQLHLALQNLSDNLLDKGDEYIGRLDRLMKSYITNFDSLLNNALTGSIDLLADRMDLILDTALNDLCAKTFICSNKRIDYGISYVNNTLLKSNSLTNHVVEIGGTAINFNSTMEISLDSLKIDPEFIIANNDHIRLVSIPKRLLKFENDTTIRMQLRIKITGQRGNKNRKWGQFWKPKEINTLLVDYTTNLILLPKYPIKIELMEQQVVEQWEECDDCEINYLGSTKSTRLTSHSVPIGNNYRVKKIINRTQNLYTVVKHDYYYFFCSEPRAANTPEGYKVYSVCFDAYTNVKGSNEIYPFFRSNDRHVQEQLFYYPYKQHFTSNTDRPVMYSIKLDKKKLITVDSKLNIEITESVDGPTPKGYLTYGDHWSYELKDNKSGYKILVYPTFGNKEKDFLILTPLTNDKAIGNFARIKSSLEHLSNESLRVKISVN